MVLRNCLQITDTCLFWGHRSSKDGSITKSCFSQWWKGEFWSDAKNYCFKYSIVLNGNWCKFSQNRALKEFLLSTGEEILAEASPYDAIWGIQLSADSPDARNLSRWRGENLLGFALMEVRDELRSVTRNESLCQRDIPEKTDPSDKKK